MKHGLTLLGLLAVCIIQAQVNKQVQYEYRIHYDYRFQPNKIDSSEIISDLMLLQTGSGHSHYLSYVRYQRDSVIKEMDQQQKQSSSLPVMPRLPKVKVQYQVFKDLSAKQLHYATAFGVKKASYHEPLPVFDWQLTTEQQTLLGYNCTKATTSYAGRDYIAWYATDIPIPDGPYKFNGLPGLILLIHDTRMHHVFSAMSVIKETKDVKLEEWTGVYLQKFETKAAFQNYINQIKENPALMFEQDFINVPKEATEKMVESAKKGIERYDNPIEL